MNITSLPRPLTRCLNRLRSAPRAEVRVLMAITVCLCLVLVATFPVLAGPGGQFAKLAAKSTLGKIVLVVLCFVLLPLGIYVMVREWIEVRKTRRDLAELAKTHDHFEWAQIEARIEEAAAAIGQAWGADDLEPAAEYMTESYFDGQQALLDRWRLEGKKNVYEFFDINKIKPLFVRVANGWWRDEISVLISAKVVDYLLDVETGKVLKGKKRKDSDYETIWTLVRENGAWRLRAIEESDESLNLAMQTNRIERAVQQSPSRSRPSQLPQPSELPASQVLEDLLPTQEEEAVVEVAGDDDAERDPGEVAQGREQQG